MSLEVKHLSYAYNHGSAYETLAVDDVSFKINKGDFVGLIGHTGSGKSTLVQLLNCLLEPSAGTVLVYGKDVFESEDTKRANRFKIGLVFQYPENQLFEMTVYDDVCFGPKNMKLEEDEIEKRAKRALALVGVEEKDYDKSPIALSGGQKRRVAIAGLLAMEPDILILDEPTAGLDPMGREDILSELKKLQKEHEMTIILVSHSMDDVANYADKVLVMDKGRLILDGDVATVFKEVDLLTSVGLAPPEISYIIRDLNEKGFGISTDITNVEDFKVELLRILNERSGTRVKEKCEKNNETRPLENKSEDGGYSQKNTGDKGGEL